MRASAIEFRFRVGIIFVIIALGYWAPWIEAWGVGRRLSLLGWLALEISRTGLLRFTAATSVVIIAGALIAAASTAVRIWGTAYLGPFTVNNMEMKAGMVMADGPYRHVRNPLYVGTWLMCAAMAFIMPATGALVAMVLLSVFLWRLILGEERFLTAQIGAPYLAYRRAVPRIIPQLRTNLPSTTHKAHWGASMLSELNPIGVFVTLAVFSWSYNNRLMVRAILVSFGLSLVVQALMPQVRRESVAA